MGLRIQNNVEAFNAHRNLEAVSNKVSQSMERLSSGYRINRAADDAAGLVISESLRAQVGGLKVASRNAQDGVSVVQTAEGALTEVHSMLQRIRDLAVQAANAGNDTTSRTALDNEATELESEIGRIATSTKFNGATLLSGAFTGAFQVGANSGDVITVSIGTLSAPAVTLSSATFASAAIDLIDLAIGTVSTVRADLGAKQNRLEHTIANLGVAVENLSASESRIRDTDMALEMTNFTKHQILLQAGTAMLGQANAAPQSVLQLLRG